MDPVRSPSRAQRRGKAIDRQGNRGPAKSAPRDLSTDWSDYSWNGQCWVRSRELPVGKFEFDYHYTKTEVQDGESESASQVSPERFQDRTADQKRPDATREQYYGFDNQTFSTDKVADLERDGNFQTTPDACYPASQPFSGFTELSMPLLVSRFDNLSTGGSYDIDSGMAVSSGTPQQPRSLGQSRNTSLPDSEANVLDSAFRFIAEPSRFFTPGRVFKVLWTEPAGDISNENGLFLSMLKNGQKTFTKVRRFVVVREMQGCCLCLSLVTHNRQGTTKSGVHSENYAAVYDIRNKPYYRSGESLRKKPFPIIIETFDEHVDPMSRLNFGRVYTIEHNLKVLKVGRIPTKHLSLLQHYFVEIITGELINEEERSKTVLNVGGGINMLPTISIPQADTSAFIADTNNGSYSPRALDPFLPNAEAEGTPSSRTSVPQTLFSDLSVPSQDSTSEQPQNSIKSKEFDRRYRVASHSFWKAGRVFMTLWTEPAGPKLTSAGWSSSSSSSLSFTSFGSSVYTTIRRFVVIQEGHGCSLCSPISTYGGQATLKANLPEVDQHAIIYTQSEAPREKHYKTADGATVRENLTKTPIRVVREQTDKEGDLSSASRLNYSKVYTVEHNVPVFNIGIVHQDSMQSLKADTFLRRVDRPKPPARPKGPSNKRASKGKK